MATANEQKTSAISQVSVPLIPNTHTHTHSSSSKLAQKQCIQDQLFLEENCDMLE